MNRFRTRRKAKNAEAEAAATARNASGKLGMNGQGISQLDLSTALPSTDQFRTSLLMPNLSARFSMLREQDDPTSKLGKASDDSVLFPKRASRLGLDFHYSEKLSDIAEVSSISGSIRPPVANERKDSYVSDGYATDDDYSQGGVMGRSRPGEGNNLFGGRQKIYKIPVGGQSLYPTPESPQSPSDNGRAMGGKQIYENDISMSAFQKLRERERLEREQTDRDLAQSQETRLRGRPQSPPLSGYNRNRETSSSTTSGPSGRSSTAATSIASQGASSIRGGFGRTKDDLTPSLPITNALPGLPNSDRNKSKRIYEQGLDKQLHDQQSSAMTRLEQISKQRALAGTPPPGQLSPLPHASSTSNLQDRFNNRPASPPGSTSTTSIGTFDFGIGVAKASSPLVGHSPLMPLSPPVSEADERSTSGFIFSETDTSMPSALGIIPRTRQEYDEQEYAERQLQMQHEKNSPPRKGSRQDPSAASPTKTRSRSQSSATRRQGVQINGFTSPVLDSSNQTRFLDSPKIGGHGELSGSLLTPTSVSEFSSHGESEAEGEKILSEFEFQAPIPTPVATFPRPNDEDHPAYKSTSEPVPIPGHAHKKSHASTKSSATYKDRKSFAALSSKDGDSPTLGPAPGLSGLVRQHLRTDSGGSSNYGPSSPIASRFYPDEFSVGQGSPPSLAHTIHSSKSSPSLSQSTYGGGNPWAPEDEPIGSASFGPRHPSQVPQPLSISSGVHAQSRSEVSSFQPTPSSISNNNGNLAPNYQSKPSASRLEPGSARGLGNGQICAPPLGLALPPIAPLGTSNMNVMQRPGRSETVSRPDQSARGQETTDDYWKAEQEKMNQSVIRGPKIPTPQMRRQERRAQGTRVQNSNEDLRGGQTPKGISPPRAGSSDRTRSDSVPRNRNERFGSESSNGNAPPRVNSPRKNTEFSSPDLGFDKRPESPGSTKTSSRARSNSRPAPPAYFDRTLNPIQTNGVHPPSNRPSPLTPFSANSTPPLGDSPPSSSSGVNLPGNPQGFQSSGPIPKNRKKSINKADISEPTFLSSTSTMTTINLPAGASLANGIESPPVPPVHPRRRRPTATQAVKSVFGVQPHKRISPPMPFSQRSTSEERAALSSGEGEDMRSQLKPRIRKISSEGGNLNIRARQQASQASSPLIPQPPSSFGSPKKQNPTDGGMF